MKRKVKIKTHRIEYDETGKYIEKDYYEIGEFEYDVIEPQEPIRFWDSPKRVEDDYYEQQYSHMLDDERTTSQSTMD